MYILYDISFFCLYGGRPMENLIGETAPQTLMHSHTHTVSPVTTTSSSRKVWDVTRQRHAPSSPIFASWRGQRHVAEIMYAHTFPTSLPSTPSLWHGGYRCQPPLRCL